MDLKDQIRKKRRQLKLSAEDLAELIGVNAANIYKWEKGTKPSNPEDYIKVTNWLGGKLESIPNTTEHREPSPMELLAGLTEGFKAIAETMKSIESKMAQESTQATMFEAIKKIDSNLTETLTGVEFVSGRQLKKILSTLSEQQPHKNDPSQDVRKKSGESDGDGHKSGIKS